MTAATLGHLAATIVAALDVPEVVAEVERRRGEPVGSLSEPLLDAQEVADLLGIPVKTVRQYAREDRMPCFWIGRNMRFVRSQVEMAVREGRLAA